MTADAPREKRYRERAEEVRAIAATVKDRQSREILLRIAEDYEQMAKTPDR